MEKHSHEGQMLLSKYELFFRKDLIPIEYIFWDFEPILRLMVFWSDDEFAVLSSSGQSSAVQIAVCPWRPVRPTHYGCISLRIVPKLFKISILLYKFLKNVSLHFWSQIISRSDDLHHYFYYPEINIQV